MTGKKIGSTSLHVFCTREELAEWLEMMSNERGRRILAFIAESPVAVHGSRDVLLNPSLYRAFLFENEAEVSSRLSMNTVRARDWGWVDVRPGENGESNGFVKLTSFEAEDYEDVRARPTLDVQWLKRKLKSVLSSGVRGINTATGAESIYRNISYTHGALEKLKRGAKWVQDDSGRVIFEPSTRAF